MKILVNGQEAVLKAGSSFEYVSENPLFTEAEDYSLEIEFPLKDCPQNILILGALHVKGVDISTVTFPCEIQTNSFNKSGILTITEVNDTCVKGQFLEGMSQQNFSASLGNILMTELDFSFEDGSTLSGDALDDYMFNHMVRENGWAPLSVINKKTGTKTSVDSNRRQYGYENNVYSRCVYLYKLLELTAQCVGYALDQSALRAIPMFDHVVVANQRVENMRQGGIRPLNLAMPRWSVKKFFMEVGKFFGCLAVIEASSKQIKFVSYNDLQTPSLMGLVNLAVLDDYTVEMQDSEGQYKGSRLYKLPSAADENHFDYCPGVDTAIGVNKENITVTEILRRIRVATQGDMTGKLDSKKLYHLTDINANAIVEECVEGTIWGGSDWDGTGWFQKLRIINQMDKGLVPDGDELGVAPCPLAPIEHNMFQTWTLPLLDIPEDPYILEGWTSNVDVIEVIKNYEKKEEDLYYNTLWIVLYEQFTDVEEGMVWDGWLPYTREYDFLSLFDQYSTEFRYYNISLKQYDYNLNPADPTIRDQSKMLKVDETKLYRYKFLASSLPSATAIYVIKGKRYACLRLTAHFTTSGMSELIEGEFYEIVG